MEKIRNIKDLAVLAGVSAGTVSRALSGSDLISQNTRDRIRALADQHGFRPNLLARNLRTQRTGTIGVILPPHGGTRFGASTARAQASALLALVADALADHGYDVLLGLQPADDANWSAHFVRSGRMDGAILLAPEMPFEQTLALAQVSPALVTWGNADLTDEYCAVGMDDWQAGALAAEHLHACGVTRPVFSGDPHLSSSVRQYDGFCMTFAALGHEGMIPVVRHDDAIEDLFDGAGPNFDAVFASDEIRAIDWLRKLAARGVNVPGAVRVIGCDGQGLGALSIPPLTTVTIDRPAAVRALVQRLLAKIAGQPVDSLSVAPFLELRGST